MRRKEGDFDLFFEMVVFALELLLLVDELLGVDLDEEVVVVHLLLDGLLHGDPHALGSCFVAEVEGRDLVFELLVPLDGHVP